MNKLIVGVDLGGTKTAVALATLDGTILEKVVHPTQAEAGPQAVIQDIVSMVQCLLKTYSVSLSTVSAIGVAAPGPVHRREGIVETAPNLAGWTDVPLRSLLVLALGRPVTVDNDARAAALAELRGGAGRGAKNLVYLALGTGIGGAVIVNGAVFRGAHELAGELGHMILDPSGPLCGGGHSGCLESFASGRAIARNAGLAMQRLSGKGPLWDLCAGDLQQITAKTVGLAVEQGDPVAIEVIEEAALRLGQAIASLAVILDSECIVLGGGLAQMGDILLKPVRSAALQFGFNNLTTGPTLVPGGLADQAGLYGALLLAGAQDVRLSPM